MPRRFLRTACLLAALGALASAAAARPTAAGGVTLPGTGWLLLAVAAGFVGSALVTVLDYALFALDTKEVELLRREAPGAASALADLRRDLDRTWYTLLAGGLFANSLFALATVGLVASLLPADRAMALVVGAIAAVAAVFIFGEVLPGLLAARWLRTLVVHTAPFTRFFTRLLYPFAIGPVLFLRLIGKLERVSLQESLSLLENERRLLAWIGLGEVDVTLEEEEREMIDHAFTLGERTARDVMRPRSEIVGFDTDTPHEVMLASLRRIHHSRVLVYDKSLDEIHGVLHTKQVLLNPENDYHLYLAPALFVPEDMDLVRLMGEMKKHRRQIVVVLDEYGATAGIASMNDILEELVGPLPDQDALAPS